VDHSLVATAGDGIKRTTWNMTARYGQMVIVGHARFEDEYMSDMNFMEFLAGKRLTGCVMGGVTLRRDIPLYMDYYRKGFVDIDALLTHRFTLDQIKEALEDAQKGALKNIIVIGGES
jgi:Zn-dependent alcohol dehydrogenase